MRARNPDRTGYTVRGGVRLYWELYGEGEPTVFLLPTWSIIHSRHWKAQVPYLARHCRVLVMDGRGCGLSDRPLERKAYAEEEFAADCLAVMDDTDTQSAALVSLSAGSRWALLMAAEHPERVTSAVFIAPAAPLVPWNPARASSMGSFDEDFLAVPPEVLATSMKAQTFSGLIPSSGMDHLQSISAPPLTARQLPQGPQARLHLARPQRSDPRR